MRLSCSSAAVICHQLLFLFDCSSTPHFQKKGEFAQNLPPKRVRRESGKKRASPHEVSLMINWKFHPSLHLVLHTGFPLAVKHTPLFHCTVDWSPASLRCTDGKKSLSIHQWSCSYHSRAPKSAAVCSKLTIFLVFTLPLTSVLISLLCKNASSSMSTNSYDFQMAHTYTFFLVVTRQKSQNVKRETREKESL